MLPIAMTFLSEDMGVHHFSALLVLHPMRNTIIFDVVPLFASVSLLAFDCFVEMLLIAAVTLL